MSVLYADQKAQCDLLSVKKNYMKEISWCCVNVSQNPEKQKPAGLFPSRISHHRHL